MKENDTNRRDLIREESDLLDENDESSFWETLAMPKRSDNTNSNIYDNKFVQYDPQAVAFRECIREDSTRNSILNSTNNRKRFDHIGSPENMAHLAKLTRIASKNHKQIARQTQAQMSTYKGIPLHRKNNNTNSNNSNNNNSSNKSNGLTSLATEKDGRNGQYRVNVITALKHIASKFKLLDNDKIRGDVLSHALFFFTNVRFPDMNGDECHELDASRCSITMGEYILSLFVAAIFVWRIEISRKDIGDVNVEYRNKQFKTRLYEVVYCSHYLFARYRIRSDNINYNYACMINFESQCIESMSSKDQAILFLLKMVRDVDAAIGIHSHVKKIQLFCTVMRLRYTLCECPKLPIPQKKKF